MLVYNSCVFIKTFSQNVIDKESGDTLKVAKFIEQMNYLKVFPYEWIFDEEEYTISFYFSLNFPYNSYDRFIEFDIKELTDEKLKIVRRNKNIN